MGEFDDFRNRLPDILKALAVGIPAGYVFDQLDTPIPWMIGPMIAVAAFNLKGMRMHSPPYARHLGQVILGSAVSLYFTPTVMAALAGNFPAILATTIAVFLIGALGALILSRVSGVERKSTFFASIPGGAMAMAVWAERHGAQIAPVAVAHSLRVSLVVILIPFALTYGGIPWNRLRTDRLCRSILRFYYRGCRLAYRRSSFGAAAISQRVLADAIFFGATLTVSGIDLSAVPHQLTDFAQLMFGLMLGARYERAFFARHRMFIPFALINSLFIMVASVVAAAFLAWAFSLPIATMIIATSPGGLAEMTITAQALQISVPLVVAFHLFRVVMVNMSTQHFYAWAAWMFDRTARR
jgi:uncharacterized protein